MDELGQVKFFQGLGEKQLHKIVADFGAFAYQVRARHNRRPNATVTDDATRRSAKNHDAPFLILLLEKAFTPSSTILSTKVAVCRRTPDTQTLNILY